MWKEVAQSYELISEQLNVHEVSIEGVSTLWPRLRGKQGVMYLCLEIPWVEEVLAQTRGYMKRPKLKCLSTQMYLSSAEIPTVIEKFALICRFRHLKADRRNPPFVRLLELQDGELNFSEERMFMQVYYPVL